MKPDFLTDDEVERLIPGLSKMKDENPFRIPENYFDSLSSAVQQKIDVLPVVEKMNRENPFVIPEDYFNHLTSAIQQRIAEEKKENVFEKWISVLLRPKYALSFAILVILIVAGIKYFSRPSITENPDSYLSYHEIKNSDYMAELDESTLIDILEQESTDNAVEDMSLEQYLLDNDIDVTQLENRL